MNEHSLNIATITDSESKQCETLYETQTAIANLLAIINGNMGIQQDLFSDVGDIDKLIEKQTYVNNKYCMWWEEIIKKYHLENYNKNNLHLTFETNSITCSAESLYIKELSHEKNQIRR